MQVDIATASRVAVVAAAVLAALATLWLDRRAGRSTGAPVRHRLLLGIPWGTLVVAAGVLAVYLFLQGGLGHWHDPLVVPFRAWSYFAPLGILTAAFAHAGPGHLLGNLFGTLALAPLVEYAWGHFPRERGSASFGSLREHPYVRAFLLFPAATLGVGLVSGAFALGPVIGFSGVVFAFAGAALLYRPLGTVVALSASGLFWTTYRALADPVTTASGRPEYVTPWWADIALQGHALGLSVGLLLAAWLAAARGDELPRPRRLALGAVLVGVEQSLWAVYWFRGGGTFVLYRAAGLALVLLAAVLVAAFAVDDDAPAAETIRGALATLTPRRGAAVALLVVTAGLAGPAVPVNLLAVSEERLPGEPVEVRGYSVTYAESIENGMVSVVDVEAFGETTSVNTSGVIVRNPERGVWTTAVSKGRLAFAGRAGVVVGGVGWRETVRVRRAGWNPVGGSAVYRVSLAVGNDTRVVFRSNVSRAEPVIAGRTVTVAPAGVGLDGAGSGTVAGTDAPTGFDLVVSYRNRTARVPVPNESGTTEALGLVFVREGDAVFARAGAPISAGGGTNGTKVRVATKETYRGQGR